jgi:ATP-dependent DNA ligase
LRTLSDVPALILRFPETISHSPKWAYAVELLLKGAETGKRANRASCPGSAVVTAVAPPATYLTWTDHGLLRHVVYQGLREDKPANEVRRERPPIR